MTAALVGPAPATATPQEPGRPLCHLADDRLVEASGLAPAAGLLWAHDDSGEGSSRLMGLDADCRTAAVVRLVGAAPVDPEDLAAHTGADGRTVLWLADTGDNRARRDEVALVQVPLPVLPAGAAGPDAPVLDAEPVAFPLAYGDGPRDAEALLVDAHGAPALVSKPLVGRPGLYLPGSALAPGRSTSLRRVGDVQLGPSAVPAERRAAGPAGPLSAGLVTGGALSPDGRAVALITYTDAHVWWAGDGELAPHGAAELVDLLGRAPDTVLPLPALDQAEAVAWAGDGGGLLVTGEGPRAPLHLVRVERPQPAAAGPDAPAPGPVAAPAPAAVAPDAGPGEPDGGGDATPGWARPAAAALVVGAWSVWAVLRRRRTARLARGSTG